MNDSYLWDGSGEPDPEVQRLESLLGAFRHNRPAPEFSLREEKGSRVWWFPHRWWLAAAAVVVVVLTGTWYTLRGTHASWEVARLAGAPRVGSKPIGDTARLSVGQWLETDHASRAKIDVGAIGEVEIGPDTRVRLAQARSTEHRLALARGTLHATIWAAPRLFFVDTPSAVAVDLGCRYTLQVGSSGAGLIRVTYGWVAFESQGQESFIPAGAMCATRPGLGPGTPYFEDASETFRTALAQLDLNSNEAPEGTKVRAAALDVILAESRPRDALTLWHLLVRISNAERARVYDRLAELVPPPAGVTREGILSGAPETQRGMRDLWWNALGLGDTSWWRMWKRPAPVR